MKTFKIEFNFLEFGRAKNKKKMHFLIISPCTEHLSMVATPRRFKLVRRPRIGTQFIIELSNPGVNLES